MWSGQIFFLLAKNLPRQQSNDDLLFSKRNKRISSFFLSHSLILNTLCEIHQDNGRKKLNRKERTIKMQESFLNEKESRRAHISSRDKRNRYTYSHLYWNKQVIIIYTHDIWAREWVNSFRFSCQIKCHIDIMKKVYIYTRNCESIANLVYYKNTKAN